MRANWRGTIRIIGAIARKDIVDALKNKTLLSIALATLTMAVGAMLLPGLMTLSGKQQAVVFDEGRSELLRELNRGDDVRLRGVSSQEEMERALAENGGTSIGLSFASDFDESLEGGATVEVSAYFAHWVEAAGREQMASFFEQRLSVLAGKPIKITIRNADIHPGPDAGGHPFMVAANFFTVLITISAFLTPYLLIEEKERKTLDVLMLSPASAFHIIAGKAIAGITYGAAAMMIMFLLNDYLIVDWGTALIAGVSVIAFGVALGLLAGIGFDSAQSMGLWMGLALLILLIPMFFTGAIGKASGWLYTVAQWLPSLSFCRLLRASFSGVSSLAETLPLMAHIWISISLLWSITIWKLKRQMNAR